MNEIQQVCQNCKNRFSIDEADFAFYKKMAVPPPTFCPMCRLQRRLAWRNERSLYKTTCKLCGKDTISLYHSNSPIATYCSPCWWSDKWDALKYGKDYDFSKPFFAQFRELMEQVPHQNLYVGYKTLVNSDYNNMNHNLKNCYWLFNSDYDEDCMYGEEVENAKDCFDITMIDHSELVYEGMNCNKCSRVYFSVDCESCADVWFSKNLSNCTSCFGCANLKNQQYCIFNKQHTKEEYQHKLKELNLRSYTSIETLKKKTQEFHLQFPYKYMHSRNNANATGDYIYHSKDVKDSYIVTESENCRYCMWLIVKGNKDCYDYTQFGENGQLVYEAMSVGNNVNNLIATAAIIQSHSIQYSIYCWSNSSNLFGCVGLRGKKYCILNKQYTQDEYEALMQKIIKHMNDMPYTDKRGGEYRYGEFFPAQLSYFAYNETSAYEFFPLTKAQVEEMGCIWKEPETKNYQITCKSSELPDSISEAREDILQQIIGCGHEGKCQEQCTSAFRILPQELKFYQAAGVPLPRLCPNCRHFQRMQKRNPLALQKRNCQCAGQTSENSVYKNTAQHFHKTDHCPNSFQTTYCERSEQKGSAQSAGSYSPEKPDIVYCEECYLREVA